MAKIKIVNFLEEARAGRLPDKKVPLEKREKRRRKKAEPEVVPEPEKIEKAETAGRLVIEDRVFKDTIIRIYKR